MHVFNIFESFAEWQFAQWSIGASFAISVLMVSLRCALGGVTFISTNCAFIDHAVKDSPGNPEDAIPPTTGLLLMSEVNDSRLAREHTAHRVLAYVQHVCYFCDC